MKFVALAIAAHPDDIEYVMAGTLLLLRRKGFAVHYFNLSAGNCGSMEMDGELTARTRLAEAKHAAELLGATFHPPVGRDLELLYSVELIRRVAATIRAVNPQIILTHSPQDYMEDHMNTSRLAVTAAFAKNMPNFASEPPMRPADGDVTIYHAMPHGLRDGLRQPVTPDFFIDTSSVIDAKRQALAAHASQQNWLSESQGMNSYLQAMLDMSAEVGRMSKKFAHAEGWRRHSHLGFSATEKDPLREALAEFCV